MSLPSFFLSEQPLYVQRRCRGFKMADSSTTFLRNGQIRYFSKETPPVFKMGGKITRTTDLYIEFEYKSRSYTIYTNKYHILYKPPKERKSKQYHLFKALLDNLDDLEK